VKDVKSASFRLFLHRKNLAAKKLSPELDVVMKEVIHVLVVNFIKEDTLIAESSIEFGLILDHSIFIYCATHR
jgi:hypothetical protein